MIKIAFYVLKINTIKMWEIVDATLTSRFRFDFEFYE